MNKSRLKNMQNVYVITNKSSSVSIIFRKEYRSNVWKKIKGK